MTDHNYSNDETIDVVISEVLKRMKLVKEPVISWQQMVYSFDGKITKPEMVSHAHKLMNDILIDGFGSLEKYQIFLDKQNKQYQDYIKRVNKNQQEYTPSPVVKTFPIETTKPTKTHRNTPVTQSVKPSSIADKIGKRRGKTLEETAKELGYESVESYLFWNRNNR